MSVLAEVQNKREYANLLASVLPHVIHTEEENDRCTAVLEELLTKKRRTAEEERLRELLTLLIEEFEEKQYALKPATPIEIVHHLMESNGLRQADLIDVFGTRSIASEVLNGKRDLAKAHIEKLSQRFHVSPELFFSHSPQHAKMPASQLEMRKHGSAGTKRLR